MKTQKIHRIGVFPDTLDPLLCREGLEGVELLYLAARSSVEEGLARKFLPREARLSFNIKARGKPLSLIDTDEAISRSDLGALLRERGVDSVITSGVISPALRSWARRYRVRIIGPSYPIQRHLDNKLWFDAFLASHHLPRPAGRPFLYREERKLPFGAPVVLQAPYSTGGLGTFVIKSHDELKALIREGAVSPDRKYLARRFVEGTPLGIAIFVCQDMICLSALRKQCFFNQNDSGRRDFAGLQWLSTDALSRGVQRRIDEVFLRLGRVLHSMRYFGFANVDFILDEEGMPQIIECNPRLSTASTQLFRFPELTSGVPVGRLFVERFFKRRSYSRRPRMVGLPQSTYRGSVLQIMPKLDGREEYLRIEHRLKGGVYVDGERALRFKGPDIMRFSRGRDEFIFLSYTKPGERYEPQSSLGQIMANYPLFTPGGRVSRDGERLIERFNPAE